jgi:hypothetical protein
MATDSSNTGRPAGQRFQVTGKVTLQRPKSRNFRQLKPETLRLGDSR